MPCGSYHRNAGMANVQDKLWHGVDKPWLRKVEIVMSVGCLLSPQDELEFSRLTKKHNQLLQETRTAICTLRKWRPCSCDRRVQMNRYNLKLLMILLMPLHITFKLSLKHLYPDKQDINNCKWINSHYNNPDTLRKKKNRTQATTAHLILSNQSLSYCDFTFQIRSWS